MSSTSVLQECQVRSVTQECQVGSVKQKCLTRVLRNSVKQRCLFSSSHACRHSGSWASSCFIAHVSAPDSAFFSTDANVNSHILGLEQVRKKQLCQYAKSIALAAMVRSGGGFLCILTLPRTPSLQARSDRTFSLPLLVFQKSRTPQRKTHRIIVYFPVYNIFGV